MKTWMKVMSGGLCMVLAGCSGGASRDGTPGTSPDATRPAPAAPVTQQQVNGLLRREAGTPLTDYHATFPTYRLLGVQPGDGVHGFATLMNTKTFATRNVGVGEALSRNVVLQAVGEHEAKFVSTTDGPIQVAAGKEFTTLNIVHNFDQASEYLGKQVYRVHPDNAARVHERYGVGAEGVAVRVYGHSGIRLSRVNTDGVLARLGFEEGDIVLAVNGAAVQGSDLTGLARQLVSPSSQETSVTVSRHGNVAAFRFTSP